jgi:hypothetical protein
MSLIQSLHAASLFWRERPNSKGRLQHCLRAPSLATVAWDGVNRNRMTVTRKAAWPENALTTESPVLNRGRCSARRRASFANQPAAHPVRPRPAGSVSPGLGTRPAARVLRVPNVPWSTPSRRAASFCSEGRAPTRGETEPVYGNGDFSLIWIGPRLSKISNRTDRNQRHQKHERELF